MCKIVHMGRQRTKNKHLPKYVILYYGSYYYKGPATNWKRINLGRIYADAMTAYGELYREVPLSTFGAVCDQYLQLVTPHKAERTQKDDHAHMPRIRAVFGNNTPSRIEAVHVYRWRDLIAAKSGAVQANLSLALLKHVFVKAIEWGACKVNPARDVRKLEVQPRDRYVEDDEYKLVYGLASPMLQVAMDLAVLTGLRRGDVLSLTRANLTDDGIKVKLGKLARRKPTTLIIEWSPELREVVARAKKLKPQARHSLVATRSGTQFTYDGFSTAWTRLMVKAQKAGLETRFNFNDLRSKSASDTENLLEASQRLGHSSTAITQRVYRRKPARVKPLR